MAIDAIMLFLVGMILGFVPGAILKTGGNRFILKLMNGGNTVMSMKERMREGWRRIEVSLEGYHIKPDAMEEIRNEYQYICFQWVQANASACVFEEYVQLADEELFKQAANPMRTQKQIMLKISDTLPDEWQETES